MKKFLILITVFTALYSNSNAQATTTPQPADNSISTYTFNRNKFTIGYEVAFPTSDLLSSTSWAGGKIEYSRMLNDQFSVGFGFSWNSFSDYVARTTYQKPDGSGALTTDYVKDIYTLPMTLSGRYYFGGLNKLLPYVGLGLGAQYSDQTIYFNIYSISENNWGFVARPELGLIFPFNDNTAMYLSGTYNYATNKSDAFSIDNIQHFALSVGFTFSSR